MKDYQVKILDSVFKLSVDTPYCFRAKVAAAIYKNKSLIAYGFNRYKTHPVQQLYAKHPKACYIHAEIDAIIKALKRISSEDFRNCDLYVARSKKDSPKGKYVPALAKPCIGCTRAIMAFGFKSVFYTENECD